MRIANEGSYKVNTKVEVMPGMNMKVTDNKGILIEVTDPIDAIVYIWNNCEKDSIEQKIEQFKTIMEKEIKEAEEWDKARRKGLAGEFKKILNAFSINNQNSIEASMKMIEEFKLTVMQNKLCGHNYKKFMQEQIKKLEEE